MISYLFLLIFLFFLTKDFFVNRTYPKREYQKHNNVYPLFLFLNIAVKENRIVVTRDKDFGDIVFRDKKQHFGIILFRLMIKHPEYQLKILKKIIDENTHEIEGNFTIATDASIKVIKLTFS